MTDNLLVDYMKKCGVDVVKWSILSSRVRGRSARVSVPLDMKDKVLNPSFWSEHARVQS